MVDIQGWGWEWVEKAHLDQLEVKTGIKGKEALFELMTSTANTPDRKEQVGDFEDKLKNVRNGKVLLRTLDLDVQSFFPIADTPDPALRSPWKYRGVSHIFGEGGKAHGAVGSFSSHPLHHQSPLIFAFIPNYPRIQPKVRFLTDYPVAMELIPSKAERDWPVRNIMEPLDSEKREWFVKLEGTVKEIGPTYTLLDCGKPVFIDSGKFLNVEEGNGLKAEGALYAYFEP
jgi:hypothetical protein